MNVSILIPCHNGSPHLAQCLQSALEQDPREVILYNDASTDDSLEIAAAFPQVQVIGGGSSPIGLQAARAALTEAAAGDWLQFLDADDYLLQHKIAAQLSVMQPEEISYCAYNCRRGGQDTKVLPHDPLLKSLALWEFLPQAACLLFPKSIASIARPMDYPTCGDYKFLIDCLKAGYQFRRVDFVGSVYRSSWSANQVTADAIEGYNNRGRVINEIELNFPEWSGTVEIGLRRLEFERSQLNGV